jgi:type II secretory pathway pseudopilin PulG
MKHPAPKRGGFTLIEILVAMVVLILLGIILTQIISSVARATPLSNQMVDADSQARLVLGRMGADLSALVKRPDVPFQAVNAPVATSNPTTLLYFVSGVPSADTRISSTAVIRDVSIVAYQVASPVADNAGPDGFERPCLVRAGLAIPWTMSGYFGLDATGMPLTYTSIPTSFLPQTTGSTSDFDILSKGVIRLVVGFQLYPDNQPVALSDNPTVSIGNAIGQVVYQPPIRAAVPYGGGTTVYVVDLSRISAIVVGIVVIDLNSLMLLTSTQVTSLGNAFPVPANGNLPVPSWGPIANAPSSLPASIPLPARQALRVFQRFYPVTPFASHL